MLSGSRDTDNTTMSDVMRHTTHGGLKYGRSDPRVPKPFLRQLFRHTRSFLPSSATGTPELENGAPNLER